MGPNPASRGTKQLLTLSVLFPFPHVRKPNDLSIGSATELIERLSTSNFRVELTLGGWTDKSVP